ncbi:MAG: IS110 family transposase [Planctomycetaceae bacterium]
MTAVGIVAEIGDFERFPTAAKFMSFVGLVPSEASSGQHVVRVGSPGGNRHVRRLLIEAAWHYYHARPNASLALLQQRRVCLRRSSTSPTTCDDCENARWYGESKSATKIVTTLARELAAGSCGPPRSPRSVCIANRLPTSDCLKTGEAWWLTNSENTRNANRHHSQQEL